MTFAMLECIVELRVLGALVVVILADSSALSQPRPLSLCIVHTKSNTADQYEPSAGPYAIAMYKQLAQQRLQNGATLRVTVLAASMQQDILPEVHRLNCSWVLQLWYHRNADHDAYNPSPPTGMPSDTAPFNTPEPIGDENSLIFALWNGGTRKVVARGAGPMPRPFAFGTAPPDPSRPANPLHPPYAAFRKQILKRLNQLP